ncbi:MAG: TPM domain-containing protein [Rudaea sp.]
MKIARICRHLVSGGAARRLFPDSALDAIQKAIAAGEQRHSEQVCFAIEGALPLGQLMNDHAARDRANDAFSHLRVWDTQNNSGVLIYVLVADHAIEILADRGIAARVGEADWAAICAAMRERFLAGDFVAGAIEGVNRANDLLARHFPADGTLRENELPDRPVLL